MELSSLFPVIDDRATAKKVKNFFEKDFERLLRLADEQTSFFRSPNYDGMPKSPSTINGQEASVIKCITSDTAKAKSILSDIDIAINHCNKTYQTILFYRYIECLPDWRVAQKVKYSTTRYNELKIAALVEFAERLCVQKNHIDLRALK
ncbi:ArpU family phage packaging/lysis transcriptional regulator [Ligilactobacillus faecis]|uniref:ArpU family phage packaging/lysis transcriptional regulator n=1 Tax=Ligilactobacillus faecis TaxID=762833 RepID=A0ABV4DPW8_9LACO